jgi:hypothetical protein
MFITLPFTAVSSEAQMGTARDTAVNGFMASSTIPSSAPTRTDINKYDNGTMIASGINIVGFNAYEVA